MKALLDSIVTKFNATSSLTTAFPGGIHLLEITRGETQPAVVIRPVPPAGVISVYGGVSIIDTLMDFIGYTGTGTNSITLESLLTGMETLAGVFDEFAFSLASGTNVFTMRMGDVVPFLVPPEDEEGERVWQANVQYVLSVDP